MKNKTLILLTSVLALAAGTASAGDDDYDHSKRCAVEASTCVREMAAALKKKGWVGIEWDDRQDPPRISHVVQGSPAQAAGVQIGDVMLAFNGIPMDEKDQDVWTKLKQTMVPGKVVTMTMMRDGAKRKIDVELVPVPEHIMAQWIGKHMLDHHAAAPEPASQPSP